jgi:hypothetical protein
MQQAPVHFQGFIIACHVRIGTKYVAHAASAPPAWLRYKAICYVSNTDDAVAVRGKSQTSAAHHRPNATCDTQRALPTDATRAAKHTWAHDTLRNANGSAHGFLHS